VVTRLTVSRDCTTLVLVVEFDIQYNTIESHGISDLDLPESMMIICGLFLLL
jgi:hypothetical protein